VEVRPTPAADVDVRAAPSHAPAAQARGLRRDGENLAFRPGARLRHGERLRHNRPPGSVVAAGPAVRPAEAVPCCCKVSHGTFTVTAPP